MTPAELRRLFAALMQRTYAAGVFLRTEPERDFPNLAPEYNRRDGAPRIRILRPTGQFFHAMPEGAELDALVSTARNIEEEICVVAHELGHHHYPGEGTEEIRDRLNAGVGVTDDERRAVYRDEIFAWDWGRTLLTELRHPDMQYFETVRVRMLGTYEAMWPSGMPPG